MKVLHVVPCADEANGVYHAARMLAKKQVDEGHEALVVTAHDFTSSTDCQLPATNCPDEVWIHGMWLPREWCACLKVLRNRSAVGVPRLVRMTHGSLSPIYLKHQGKWKKRLVSPIERWLFSKTDRVVVTGEWEAEWCRQWGLKNEMQILDLKQYFKIKSKCEVEVEERTDRELHVLYLGRRHPLKGVQYLEQAVKEINQEESPSLESKSKSGTSPIHSSTSRFDSISLRIVSSLFGDEKEKAWQWCDVLCLPTLSENFGLVVAEALEHGKRVITTDGAPAWKPPPEAWDHLVYLRGYRDGTDEERVKLLKDALKSFVGVADIWYNYRNTK